MVYEVVWTEKALQDLEAVMAYLEANFTENITQSFIAKLTKKLTILENSPYIYVHVLKKKRVHRCLILSLLKRL
jgi:plasmid stabilization system protein ParE